MYSTQTLYDSSCKESNEIAELARSKGGLGTKITGAGWGGCTLTLVEASKSQQFIEEMKKEYYYKKPELKERIEKIGI